MLVIIEGNEGTGKTTLINQLKEHMPFISVKYSKECKHMFESLEFYAKSKQLYVLDRGFVTDMVYRINDLRVGQTSLQEIGVLANMSKIIFCESDTGYEDAMKRGENNITDINQYQYIDSLFDAVLKLLSSFTRVDIMRYRYGWNSVEHVVKFIKEED